jgi:hypothetical protein
MKETAVLARLKLVRKAARDRAPSTTTAYRIARLAGNRTSTNFKRPSNDHFFPGEKAEYRRVSNSLGTQKLCVWLAGFALIFCRNKYLVVKKSPEMQNAVSRNPNIPTVEPMVQSALTRMELVRVFAQAATIRFSCRLL